MWSLLKTSPALSKTLSLNALISLRLGHSVSKWKTTEGMTIEQSRGEKTKTFSGATMSRLTFNTVRTLEEGVIGMTNVTTSTRVRKCDHNLATKTKAITIRVPSVITMLTLEITSELLIDSIYTV